MAAVGGSRSAHIPRRHKILVVTRHTSASERPVDKNHTTEDRIARHRPKVAAVLREAAIVTEDEVLTRAETGEGKVVRRDFVCLLSVDHDPSPATDYRVARNPNHTLADIEVTRLGVGYNRPAQLAPSAKRDDLASVWIAKAIGESLGQPAPITSRNRRGHARTPVRPPQDDEACPREHRDKGNDPDDHHHRNDHALATKPRCCAHRGRITTLSGRTAKRDRAFVNANAQCADQWIGERRPRFRTPQPVGDSIPAVLTR